MDLEALQLVLILILFVLCTCKLHNFLEQLLGVHSRPDKILNQFWGINGLTGKAKYLLHIFLIKFLHLVFITVLAGFDSLCLLSA